MSFIHRTPPDPSNLSAGKCSLAPTEVDRTSRCKRALVKLNEAVGRGLAVIGRRMAAVGRRRNRAIAGTVKTGHSENRDMRVKYSSLDFTYRK